MSGVGGETDGGFGGTELERHGLFGGMVELVVRDVEQRIGLDVEDSEEVKRAPQR